MAAAGVGAAAILCAAAWVAGGDPAAAARGSLGRLAEAGTAAVGAAWARLAAEEEPAPALGERVRWRADDPLDVVDAPPRAGDGGASADFVLLLAAAERAELAEGAAAQALADLEELLGRRDGGELPRARALARAVRIAARLGEWERAHSLFERARAELAGDEAGSVGEAQVSALLLAGLALAPGLGEGARAELGVELAERWAAGALALPGGDPSPELAGEPAALFLREDPLRQALGEHLGALGPGAGAPLAARARAQRARALAAVAGPLDAPEDGAWRVRRTPLGLLALRAEANGWRAAQLVWQPELAGRLAERARADGLLPPGLALELEGLPPPAGERLGEPTALPGAGLVFALRHADAGAVLAAERRRSALLRAGLFVAALAVAAAGLVAARSLARGRRLVELRARFVASVTHELRTPLASILMLAENLEQGRATDPARAARYPGLIRREAERLRRLVDDVLDAARIEQGAPPRVEPGEHRLAPLAAELGAELEALAAGAGGSATFRAGPLPERARLDREALRRAARNLLDNALVHGGARCGPIEVALEAPAGRLRLAVRDHGPGVPAARREAAFAPFERLDSGAAPGAGLGLWIVRELARAQGGDAWLESPASGSGAVAVFEVELDSRDGGGPAAPGVERGVA